ncbi:DNA primase [Orpheovirus IHUMI-LCC2]|uniref:VV D5-like helicase/primase n=1 Tax=Orpheovirus IHUMI-LCC2 TaxID=2023057 RepID=A0A2I2L651_9VIRU|nr:DNA primase [Orpheovirus IHUMI-LCC2]SNW63028.1 VV D5-like helicase/primase [Orpheovirus IHUMI-LCC2]
MDGDVLELLRRCMVQGATNNPTHCSVFQDKKYWSLKQDMIETFWIEYCKLVDEKPELQAQIAEIVPEDCPFVMDFLFKFDFDTATITDPFIKRMVKIVQDVLFDYLQISATQHELNCVVLRSREDNNIDGNKIIQLRFHFPYCRVPKRIHAETLRPEILRRFRQQNVLGQLSFTPKESWDKICNDRIPMEYLPMYGCLTDIKLSALTYECTLKRLATEHLESDIHDDIEDENGIVLDARDIWQPTAHKHVIGGYVNPDRLKLEYLDAEYWLPMMLSIYYPFQVTLPKTTSPGSTQTPESNRNRSPSYVGDESYVPRTDIDLAQQVFLRLISPERFNIECTWLEIGYSLFNVTNGSDLGLEIWSNFTEEYSNNYTSDDCSLHYGDNNFTQSSYTIKTLAWYAKLDSPEEYKTWHEGWVADALDGLSKEINDYTLALVFYRLYWLENACSINGKTESWYVYDGNIWQRDDDASRIRKQLSTEFRRVIEGYQKHLADAIWYPGTAESAKKGLQEKLEKIQEIFKGDCRLLMSGAGKNNIVKALKEEGFFKNTDLERYRDRLDHVLSVYNFVIDTSGREAIARCGKPEDYLTKRSCVFYRDYGWDHPQVQKVMHYMKQVFPDPDLMNYFLKYSASCLRKRNMDKLFMAWVGKGDNSKSMIIKLFEATFGQSYCIKMDVKNLSGKNKGGGGPNPEFARCKGTNVAFIQETDENDDLSKGLLKLLTGGDSFFARMLHDNGGDIDNTFKIILVCNDIPKIPNADEAVFNRFRIIPFLSKWTSDAPADEAEQFKQRKFKKDPRFERKIAEYASPFLWILIQYWKTYLDEGLKEPEIVKRYTDDYWNLNDAYLQYKNTMLEEMDDELPESITIQDIYPDFINWYRRFYPGEEVPKFDTARKLFCHRMGGTTGVWNNFRRKEAAVSVA